MLKTFFIVCILILSCAAHPHGKIGACPDYTGLIQHSKFLLLFRSSHCIIRWKFKINER